MKITQELVERIAYLARLALSDEEKENMAAQLEDILGSITSLDKLVLEEDALALECTNVLRPDEPENSMESAALLGGAPETDGAYILVPDAMRREQG